MTKRKTLPAAIFMVFVMTFLLAIGQVFLKFGANNLTLDFLALFTNYSLIIGLSIYVFSTFIFLFALNHGEVSILSPIFALTYIWVSILAFFLFTEPFTSFKIIGLSVIFIGVSLIGLGSK